ncbi:hypothetical protein SDC9_177465 [bioreactor metagenome]|uniref:Uncharacterized protein n=1 Tax=bioreactor metagenome TaxID=1076179 RepID=A0A645GT35_9ZZZZ
MRTFGEGDHAVVHRNVEVFAFAGAQLIDIAEHGRVGRVDARAGVSEREAEPCRRPLRVAAAGVHKSRHRLRDNVIGQTLRIGPLMLLGTPEAADGHIDHAWIDLFDLLIGKAEFVHQPGLHIFDNYFRILDEIPEDGLSFRRLHIDRHALFAAVEAREIPALRLALVVFEHRRHFARGVSASRTLHFDHVRALVGEHHRTGRSRDLLLYTKNLYSFKYP